MKQLLLGNEAVARGLYEAGVRVVSSYHLGTPRYRNYGSSSPKFEEIYCEWAPDATVAAEVAAGASIAGARSFCAYETCWFKRSGRPFIYHLLHRDKRRYGNCRCR